MERIITQRTATKKTILLALALALAIAMASYANPEFRFAGEHLPASAAVASKKTTNSPSSIPKDEILKLTVPKMDRVKDLPVHDGPATAEDTLGESVLHVQDTGFLRQENANV